MTTVHVAETPKPAAPKPAAKAGASHPSPFSVIDGGKSKLNAAVLGSAKWAQELRAEAQSVAASMDTAYLHLARLIYLAQTQPIDGEDGPPAYKVWGFGGWEDWVEQELDIDRRKASALKRIWIRLAVELKDLEADKRDAIVALGWTKVREVVRVLTVKNADHWIAMGKNLSYPDFRKAVSTYADQVQAVQAQSELGANQKIAEAAAQKAAEEGDEGLPPPMTHSPAAESIASKVAQVSGAGFDADDPDGAVEAAFDAVPLPTPEKTFPMSFAFYAAQLQVVKAALDKAATLSPSKTGSTKSHNLHLICLEFLSNLWGNDATDDQRLGYLAQLEERLGVRLVVVSKADKAIIGGHEIADMIRDGSLT